MKTYTGIELLQAIKDGEIKGGTKIEVHDLSVLDKLVTTISVNSDRGLAWKTGEFDTSFLLNDYYYFKITDIDIQEIEEIPNEVMRDDWRYYVPVFFNKINEIIRVVNKKIEEDK